MRAIETIGALFDLDGVLIDSEGTYTEFWDGIGRRYHSPIPDFAHAIKGTTLTQILDGFPAGVRAEITQAIHDFELEMRYPLFPGVNELLDELHAAGIPMAIVTSSDDVKMASLYRQHPHFADRFAAVITGSQVSRSKPHPEGYLRGAEAIGRRAADCFVFEDSLQGLEAGRRAGATVVGIATTNPRAALEGRADTIVDTIAALTLARLLAL